MKKYLMLFLLALPVLVSGQWNSNIVNKENWWTATQHFDSLYVEVTIVDYIDVEVIEVDSMVLGVGHEIMFEPGTYIYSPEDGKLFVAANDIIIWEASADSFHVNVRSSFDGSALFYGEVFLGNAATDTTEIYGITRFRQPVYFDSTGANRTIDLSAEDDGDASKFWFWAASNNYWRRNGRLTASAILTYTYYLFDDCVYHIGGSINATYANAGALSYETADADANLVLLTMPNGGAVDVPVFLFADSSYYRVTGGLDLGFFNGITDPSVAILSSLTDGAMRIAGQVAGDSLAGFYSHGVNKGFHFYDDVKIDSTLRLAPIATPANPIEGQFFITSTGDSLGVYLASGWKWFIGGE